VSIVPAIPELMPHHIVLMTGASGCGKSQSIPPIACSLGSPDQPPPWPWPVDKPILDACGVEPKAAARLLGRVGLADAFTWARSYSELSVGQQARADLAMAIAHGPQVVVIDEWLANLDRMTARAVAWSTAKELRRSGMGALFVTAHEDLVEDLSPDLHIRIGWSPEPDIRWRQGMMPECSILGELRYRSGTARDWARLKALHYAAGDPATVHSYHVLEWPGSGEPAAVAILSYPDLHSAARNLATDDAYRISGDRRSAQRMNREVRKLSRIVVTPELRGVGVAGRLIEHVMAESDARYIECSTAMGPYTGFLQRLGFREIPQTSGPAEARLLDWAVQQDAPADAPLDPEGFASWIDSLSVRKAREGRRLVWLYYQHFVLHRRTKCRPPKRIPGPSDPRWPEAFDVAARRLRGRPEYYIIGPIDRMTGRPEDEPEEGVREV